MKKYPKLLLSLLFSLPFLAACGSTSSSSTLPVYNDPEEIVVRFVNSSFNLADPANLAKMNSLETMLAERIPGHTFDVSTGTSYEAVLTGMVSNQVHVGFLTSQQYAKVSLENEGKVNVLLSSVRDQYAQLMNGSTPITAINDVIAAVNAPGWDGHYTHDAVTTYYHAGLYVSTASYNAGIDTIAELAGKTIGVSTSTTSGSGYVYPKLLMAQNGMKVVTTAEPSVAANEVRFLGVSGGHQKQLEALVNGDVDAAFAFMDARVNTTAFDVYNAVDPAEAGESPRVVRDTKLIALSAPITNDTISASAELSPTLQTQIQNAFLDIIDTEEGGALLFSVYAHKGYAVATDDDYETERETYIALQNLE